MLVFLSFEGGGYATLRQTAQGVENALRVPIATLSQFNFIISHPILYQNFRSLHWQRVSSVGCKGKRKFWEWFTLAKGNLMAFIDK